MIQFTIPGRPRPKQRPRVLRTGITYTPKETLLYEERVIEEAKKSGTLPQSPIEGIPLRMIIYAYMPIPASWPKQRREQAAHGEIQPTSRPDIDNLAKIIMDALNGVAYKDDAQVCQLVINKAYDIESRVEVVIDEM